MLHGCSTSILQKSCRQLIQRKGHSLIPQGWGCWTRGKTANTRAMKNQPTNLSSFNWFPVYSVQTSFSLASNALTKAGRKANAWYREGTRLLPRSNCGHTQTILKKKKQEQAKKICATLSCWEVAQFSFNTHHRDHSWRVITLLK